MAMNLGDAPLKFVNSSKPKLQHTNSLRSAAASDDYYSLSDHSQASSGDDQTTVIRYQTPPSRTASAQRLRDETWREQQGSRLSTHEEVSSNRTSVQTSRQSVPAPVGDDEVVQLPAVPEPIALGSVRFDHTAPRNSTPVDMKEWRAGKNVISPPTPGVDDTPYIQFAIDQLTRDEEALGRSREAGSPQPVAPVSPVSTSPEPQHITRDFALYNPDVQPRVQAPAPAARRQSVSPLSSEEERGTEDEPILVAAKPPQDNFRYPPLSYVPTSLRLPAIASLCSACLLLIILIALSMGWSARHQGLWHYDGVGTSRYFLAEYLPQLLAVLILIWLQTVLAAVQRILPFALLTDSTPKPRNDIFSTVPLYITNHLLPNRSLIRKSEPLLAFFAISTYLTTILSLPLASTLYQTRLFTPTTSSPWVWATVQPIGIIIIALYTSLLLSLLALHIRFSKRPTGLKWDPTSLADIMVLLRRSSPATSPRNSQLAGSRPASLGYWESPSHPGAFFHGIGASQSPTRLHLERGVAVARPVSPSRNITALPQTSTFESWQSNTPSTQLHPRFLRPLPLFLAAILAVVLLLAYLLASYIHAALLSGFSPLLATATSSTSSFSSFSPSNFLYSFLPALLATLVPLLWIPMDLSARFLAPFLALAKAGQRGVPASESLLLSYPAEGPFIVILSAVLNGHWVVAAGAVLTLVAWAVPVVAGGIFTAQFVSASEGSGSSGTIKVRADSTGLVALTVLLVLVAVGWVTAWAVAQFALRRSGSLKKATIFQRGRRAPEKAATGTDGRDLEKGRSSMTGPATAEAWLAGSDVRTLQGVGEVIGQEVLALRVWREPRGREDLVGRLVGRGRGRWSWAGEGGGVERKGVQERV